MSTTSTGRPIEILTVEDNPGDVRLAQETLRDAKLRNHLSSVKDGSEERFSKAFHASPAAKSITRLSDGSLIDANESYRRILEYAREELIDSTSIGLSIFENTIERAEIVRMLHEHVPVRDFETKLRTKSGEIRGRGWPRIPTIV